MINTELDYMEMYNSLGIKMINGELQHNSIEPLELFLTKRETKIDIELGNKAIQDLIKQVDFYKNRCYTFGILTMDNIYVIDEEIFIIKNTELMPIIDKYYISINSIYSKDNILLPPELKSNTEIPFKTRATMCYFSIGKIVEKIIFKSKELSKEQIKSTLGDSSLYFCLYRATKENPTHRYLLYI